MVATLISAYMFAAPYITANRMLKALRHHDAATLNEYIDFDAVRRGLRRQLQHVLEQQVPDGWCRLILDAIGAEQRQLDVGELTDQAVTAESLTNFCNASRISHSLTCRRTCSPTSPCRGVAWAHSR